MLFFFFKYEERCNACSLRNITEKSPSGFWEQLQKVFIPTELFKFGQNVTKK